MQIKNTLFAGATFAILGFGGVLLAALPASARIVCNSYGDCWHSDANYNYDRYDRGQHAQYHKDDWYFHQNWNNDHEHHYRDTHEGRGYYKSGVWIGF